jgi:hypothetical protein
MCCYQATEIKCQSSWHLICWRESEKLRRTNLLVAWYRHSARIGGLPRLGRALHVTIKFFDETTPQSSLPSLPNDALLQAFRGFALICSYPLEGSMFIMIGTRPINANTTERVHCRSMALVFGHRKLSESAPEFAAGTGEQCVFTPRRGLKRGAMRFRDTCMQMQ